MKDERSWIPGTTDLDWIESIAADLPPALAAIEDAAQPKGIPIVDRDAGRVLSVLAGGRRRIVEVGTAYGFSTLWLSLGQPADGTIVTIDPDLERKQIERLQAFKARRDSAAVEARLAELAEAAARPDRNVMPVIVDSVRDGVTLGEICDTWRQAWGTWREEPVF